MRIFPHLVGVLGAIVVASLPTPVRADQAPSLGISLDGYFAPVRDDSVTNMSSPQPQERSRGLVGLATVANLGSCAVGSVVDGFPSLFGNGRLTVGGLAGWQPQSDSHRFQVLGELGAERFSDVGGNLLTSPDTHETWLPYVGARLGTSETFSRDGHFELGAWLFVRKDLGEATVTNTSSFLGDSTTTEYRLGGYSVGAALRIGVRFDQKRTAESAGAEPAEPAGT
jgi:hypothetical protein